MDEREQSSLFREWYRKHLGIIVRIARANALNPHDQKDLIQEISIQIWNSIPQFKGNSKESTWIYRVALNTAINQSEEAVGDDAQGSILYHCHKAVLEKNKLPTFSVKSIRTK